MIDKRKLPEIPEWIGGTWEDIRPGFVTWQGPARNNSFGRFHDRITFGLDGGKWFEPGDTPERLDYVAGYLCALLDQMGADQ